MLMFTSATYFHNLLIHITVLCPVHAGIGSSPPPP
uniref:Uncharacterized protein n=1 Tax=Anguilla anguilla TaxID=7936 RepID=A0A0E9TR93_ANGAN